MISIDANGLTPSSPGQPTETGFGRYFALVMDIHHPIIFFNTLTCEAHRTSRREHGIQMKRSDGMRSGRKSDSRATLEREDGGRTEKKQLKEHHKKRHAENRMGNYHRHHREYISTTTQQRNEEWNTGKIQISGKNGNSLMNVVSIGKQLSTWYEQLIYW